MKALDFSLLDAEEGKVKVQYFDELNQVWKTVLEIRRHKDRVYFLIKRNPEDWRWDWQDGNWAECLRKAPTVEAIGLEERKPEEKKGFWSEFFNFKRGNL